MKKIKPIVIMLALAFILTACGNAQNTENTTTTEPAKVITTAEVETKVDEYEEDKYIFEPAELTCYMPEDFEETDYPGEYLHKKYPDDVSSINHVIVDSEGDATKMTKEEFITDIEQEYYDGYGEKVEVNVTQYAKIMVDGRPGLWIMYNFDFRGEHFETLLVILYNGTESHSVTFLQGPGTDHMEEFIETANTIGFSKIEE